MSLYKTKAIVGKGINLGEADKIVTFYTESMGKIKGVGKRAKGIKNKFGAGLEPFTHVELILFAKENAQLYQINSVQIIKYFPDLFDDLKKIILASYFTEFITLNTKEGIPNQRLFNLLLRSYSLIGSNRNLEEILRIFELKAISLLGYLPNFKYCIYCQKGLSEKDTCLAFNFLKGGIVCSRCWDKNDRLLKISRGTLQFAEKGLQLDLDKTISLIMPRRLKKEIEVLIHTYTETKLEKITDSYRLLADFF